MMHFPPTKFEAILDLVGNDKEFSVSPEGEFIWKEDSDEGKPSESEIQTRLIELQAEWDAQEYARNRATEYPSTGDQLDYIFHNGVAKWKTDMIEPVKAKYPKPS